MNIEIANKLIELRKKSGLSQEELAAKLGLSRQAVSKWERAESSPDTDNLICLAKLYNISLDELLNTEESIEDISREVKERNDDYSKRGLRLDERIRYNKEHKYDYLKEEERPRAKAYDTIEKITTGILYITAVIIYILISSYHSSQWSKLWVVFLIPVVISSIFDALKNRRFHKFVYPVVTAIIYLVLGLYKHIWTPSWIIFLTIPMFYMIFIPIDRLIAKKRNELLDPEDYDDDYDDED